MLAKLIDRISSAAVKPLRFVLPTAASNQLVVAGVAGMRIAVVSLELSTSSGGVVEFHFKNAAVTDSDFVSSGEYPPTGGGLKVLGDAAPVGPAGQGLYVDTTGTGLRGVVQYALIPEA